MIIIIAFDLVYKPCSYKVSQDKYYTGYLSYHRLYIPFVASQSCLVRFAGS